MNGYGHSRPRQQRWPIAGAIARLKLCSFKATEKQATTPTGRPGQHPVRAAIYVRISYDRTGAGLGVARQEEDCRALCERNGWDVAGWDRLTRTPRELEDVIDLHDKAGIELATATGEIDLATPTGRLVARTLGAAARHESEYKGERQRRAARQAAEQGKAPAPACAATVTSSTR